MKAQVLLLLVSSTMAISLNTEQKWHVSPDYGELDDYIVGREKDSANGEKKSGWTNPLGWTDDGDSDDLVLAQTQALEVAEPYVRAYSMEGYGSGPEKVSVPDPRIAHTHTTFYDKKNGVWRTDAAAL